MLPLGSGGIPFLMMQFGGRWTEEKLTVLRKYLSAYATILSKYGFRFAYIDAFAGAGYRTSADTPQEQETLDFLDGDARSFFAGSTRIALSDPRFSSYVFIEKNASRAAELGKLRDEFVDLSDKIVIENDDCNVVLQRMAAKYWGGQRALVFLDPFGMQVSWKTVAALAATKAVDVFYLFPLGVGVNRMLTRSGNIDERWKERLTDVFGTPAWEKELYHRRTVDGLFGDQVEEVEKASIAEIGRYFLGRLRTVFPYVADPLPLYNSTNCPIFLLCFGAANPRGGQTAVKITNDLLRRLSGLPPKPRRPKPQDEPTLFED